MDLATPSSAPDNHFLAAQKSLLEIQGDGCGGETEGREWEGKQKKAKGCSGGDEEGGEELEGRQWAPVGGQSC